MGKTSNLSGEPILEMLVFETNQLIEQLEEILLNSEHNKSISLESINEIFRIMHTIKGSSAMMMFNNISSLAHSVEDLFYFIRENKPSNIDYSLVCDLVLISSDFIKMEISKIEDGKGADGNEEEIANKIKAYLSEFSSELEANKNAENITDNSTDNKHGYYESKYNSYEDLSFNNYSAKVFFEEGCQMENIRAYTIIHSLKDLCRDIYYVPENIIDDISSSDYIVENGFDIFFTSNMEIDELKKIFEQALFVRAYEFNIDNNFVNEVDGHFRQKLCTDDSFPKISDDILQEQYNLQETLTRNIKQSLISVNTKKLDKLMDLVGEIVITESMVTTSPDIKDLQLDNFNKAARQLRKLTDELQDIVMSIRMIPIASTFQKMHRIVRDMGKKLNKEVDLILSGEDTEVDKNIIDNLSDPLMHVIRNAMDHGIEAEEDRVKKGKSPKGRITLEAKEIGGEVVINVSDDGKGLDKTKILEKAKIKGFTNKADHEYTDREIFSFIMLPGFSTNDNVTEYSGRGVGMDVVKKNIEQIGGSVLIDSVSEKGTSIMIKIPLTLAIVNGMEISVGNSIYTIPTNSIKESFKPYEKNYIKDTEGTEMIMIRGSCYPIVRIHRLFKVETQIQNLYEGILVMVEGDGKTVCLFADRLICEQQVVVKPIPSYLMRFAIKGSGIAGCTILGDGTISLILDVSGIVNRVI